jgi:hypothetical protein
MCCNSDCCLFFPIKCSRIVTCEVEVVETEQQAGSGESIDVAEQYDSDARRRQGGQKVAQVAVLASHARSSRRGQRREAGARRDPLRRRDAPTGTGGPALSLVGPSDAGREKETLPPLGSSELPWAMAILTRRPAVGRATPVYRLRAGTSTTMIE